MWCFGVSVIKAPVSLRRKQWCDLFTVFHSAGPTALTDSSNGPQTSSHVYFLATCILYSFLVSSNIWSYHSIEGINILPGQRGNSLIHPASFNANVKQAYWVCCPLFARKVRCCFVCPSAFAGSSECKDMDQSERENRWKEHNHTKTDAILTWVQRFSN